MYAPLRKNAITISGKPLSGKSTINNALVQSLGYKTYSVGDKVKQLAAERGVTPEDFYKKNIIEIDGAATALDPYLDSWQQQIGEQEEKFVVDSRIGFHFIPQSFRVFLDCDIEAAAQRAHQARKHNPAYATPKYESMEKAKKTIAERVGDERQNYAGRYGIPDFHLPFHYDLVVDTTTKKPGEVADKILREYERYEKVTGEIALICWGLKMVVANRFTYFSGPITGSKALYKAMKEHDVKRKEDLPKAVYDLIRQQNVDRSRELEERVRLKEESPALLPGKLGSADIWSQRDYVDLSKETIRLKATELIFEDGWQYSNGCVEELLLALQLKKPMYDQQENPLGKEKAVRLLATAVDEIHQLPAECPKLDFLLEQLKRV
ncbi:MAG TPA: cytidylate kinase family protein [Candidatus Nanoarchaeia archaeon]|nr:cytidylate kinase family protein [Candidatus Nanoarchaeia archaeon]